MTSLYRGSRKKTTEMFKEELKALGSNVIILGEYTKARSKIACLCPDCNYLWDTTPNRMLSAGSGCPKCGGRILLSVDEVNQKLTEQGFQTHVVGEVNRNTDKLQATCKVCDHTWESEYKYVLKSGYCKVCSKNNRENPNPYEQKVSNEFFQSKLDEMGKNFTLVGDYAKSHKPVTVMCNNCERIWTNTASVILTNGCAQCSQKLKGSLEKVQEKLDISNKRIVVSGEYVNAFTKINCSCTYCGEQWQATPHTLSSCGCPFCCFKGRIPKDRPAHLYYVRVNDVLGTFWKIGITTKYDVMERFAKDNRKKITLLYSFLFENGADAYYAEKNILRLYKKYLVAKGINILSDGNTEIFTHDVLQMDHLGGRL